MDLLKKFLAKLFNRIIHRLFRQSFGFLGLLLGYSTRATSTYLGTVHSHLGHCGRCQGLAVAGVYWLISCNHTIDHGTEGPEILHCRFVNEIGIILLKYFVI